MLQANQWIIEFLFWMRNLWSHLAWFTLLKIMIPTKNSINDNDFFFIVMIDMFSKCHSMHFKWTYFCNRHSLHDL
jgi:hypothetical protein